MIVTGRDYEHTLALPNDPAAPISYRPVELGATIQAILRGEPFEASEFTLAGAIILHDQGRANFSAIPIFPARSFFHSCLWVRRDSEITSFGQLAGKRIGLRDFSSTTSVWFRGHLGDAHGVDWSSITWVVGPNRRFPPPAAARNEPAGDDLEAMLEAGSIDAFFSVRVRDQKKPPAERELRPLLADPHAAEAEYLRTSGLYPLLHVVVVSHEAIARDAEAPRKLFDALEGAKQAALKRRIGATLLPWGEALWERTLEPFGGDPLVNGLGEANRLNLETLIGYLRGQELIGRTPRLEDLFAPGSAAWIPGGTLP